MAFYSISSCKFMHAYLLQNDRWHISWYYLAWTVYLYVTLNWLTCASSSQKILYILSSISTYNFICPPKCKKKNIMTLNCIPKFTFVGFLVCFFTKKKTKLCFINCCWCLQKRRSWVIKKAGLGFLQKNYIRKTL